MDSWKKARLLLLRSPKASLYCYRSLPPPPPPPPPSTPHITCATILPFTHHPSHHPSAHSILFICQEHIFVPFLVICFNSYLPCLLPFYSSFMIQDTSFTVDFFSCAILIKKDICMALNMRLQWPRVDHWVFLNIHAGGTSALKKSLLIFSDKVQSKKKNRYRGVERLLRNQIKREGKEGTLSVMLIMVAFFVEFKIRFIHQGPLILGFTFASPATTMLTPWCKKVIDQECR